MNSFPAGEVLTAGLATYAFGALSGLLLQSRPRQARQLACGFALAGAVMEGVAAVAALTGSTVAWTLSSGVPLFAYSFSLDSLSAFFNLALSVLVALPLYSPLRTCFYF
jgi:hypothetical protein